MSARRIAIAALLGAGLLAVGAAFVSCIDTSGTETNACPNEAVFTGLGADGGPTLATPVSEYMGQRCGTLDCHGSIYIPLRLYDHYGLRLPTESNVSGGAPTTQAELLLNYGTVCTLQPTQTAAAVTDPNSAEQLLIVLKSRGLMSHKGGAVVKEGDPGDECIAGWLRGDAPATVSAACETALGGL
jgi:hypothetical protein